MGHVGNQTVRILIKGAAAAPLQPTATMGHGIRASVSRSSDFSKTAGNLDVNAKKSHFYMLSHLFHSFSLFSLSQTFRRPILYKPSKTNPWSQFSPLTIGVQSQVYILNLFTMS